MDSIIDPQILQQIREQPVEYWIGTAAGIITWIIMGCLLYQKKIFQTQRRTAEKYTKMGHRIEAELIDVTHHRHHGERYYRAAYRYTVDGKTYEYSQSMDGPPPSEIYVYYDKDPKKAFVYGDMKGKYVYILWFIIPMSVALGTALLAGFLIHR